LTIIIFYFFSIITIACCLNVIISSNEIMSVLFLVLGFCNAAGIVFCLGCEFIAILFLIIYVGAVAVLFLFVVIMLDVSVAKTKNKNSFSFTQSFISVFIFFTIIQLFESNKTNMIQEPRNKFDINWLELIDKIQNVVQVGDILFNYYIPVFLIAGFILLCSIIGAIVITLNSKKLINATNKRQKVFQQLARKKTKAIFIIK